MDIASLGWCEFFENRFGAYREQGWIPARVGIAVSGTCRIYCEHGELTAETAGRVHYESATTADLPVVGDWVAAAARPEEERGTIQAVLPRKSRFSRTSVGGRTEEQVVTANVDTVLLVSALDGSRNFNLKKIERYLTLAWESGADPVVVLNKADLCADPDACVERVVTVARGVPVHAVSAATKRGLDALLAYLGPGKTIAMLGPSGVGKSTLINALLGEERLPVAAIRDSDKRGRHTTTAGELIFFPGGGMIIDTPGMRDIQVWADEEGLRAAFDDVEALAERCRFRDCKHRGEPGCAVQAAVEGGELEAERLESYHKLRKEVRHLVNRQNQQVRQAERTKWKKIHQWGKGARERKERFGSTGGGLKIDPEA